jgi:hypothetical protein
MSLIEEEESGGGYLPYSDMESDGPRDRRGRSLLPNSSEMMREVTSEPLVETAGNARHLGVYHLDDEYMENLDEYVHETHSRLVQRQREQATMFGMPKWKAQVRRKSISERSQHVREILEGSDTIPSPEMVAEAAESKVS